jgi:hypothetical protein
MVSVQRPTNPFFRSPARTPIILLYKCEAEEDYHPYHWHAALSSMPIGRDPREHTPGKAGFPISGAGRGPLHTERQEELLEGLREAGWDYPIFEIVPNLMGPERVRYMGTPISLATEEGQHGFEAEEEPALAMTF